MTASPTTPPSGRHETDPPDVRLVVLAGIQILSRIIDRPELDAEDLARLRAYVRALVRLRNHLGEP